MVWGERRGAGRGVPALRGGVGPPGAGPGVSAPPSCGGAGSRGWRRPGVRCRDGEGRAWARSPPGCPRPALLPALPRPSPPRLDPSWPLQVGPARPGPELGSGPAAAPQKSRTNFCRPGARVSPRENILAIPRAGKLEELLGSAEALLERADVSEGVVLIVQKCWLRFLIHFFLSLFCFRSSCAVLTPTDFEKRGKKEVCPILDQFLCHVAKTGETM